MGLRFRKSVSLFPGVRLNFSKSGMSVSSGVPGFRKTINTKGHVTTTVGIPGTGLYYVDTKKAGNNQSSRSRNTRGQQPVAVQQQPTASYTPPEQEVQTEYHYKPVNDTSPTPTKQVDVSALKSIHKTADDTIDWTEILVSPTAPDDSYNQQMWEYYYSVAPDVLSGDIDTYLRLIYEVNPLDDLLEYGTNFDFGTDDPSKIEVEYTINTDVLSRARQTMSRQDYNDLLQDFVCSLSIRIARDMFALLPINETIIYALMDGQTILTVVFDRISLSKVKFGYIEPIKIIQQFNHSISIDSL